MFMYIYIHICKASTFQQKVLLCNNNITLYRAAVWMRHNDGSLEAAPGTMVRKSESLSLLPNNNCVYKALQHLLIQLFKTTAFHGRSD